VTHQRSQTHEIGAHLTHAHHGVDPYWALRNIIYDLDGGVSDIPVEINGEEWEVSLGYESSGLDPRPEDDVEQLHEYRLLASGDGERKLDILAQPRFDWATENRPQSVPADLGQAVNLKTQSSNIHPLDLPTLIPELYSGLFDELGIGWNDDYFRGPLHEYSSVWAIELYYRPQRDLSQKLTGLDGVFQRAIDLLADQRGTAGEYVWDNTGGDGSAVVGHFHTLQLGNHEHGELFPDEPGDRPGAQLKLYHPEHARSEASDDPLSHPKLGILFKQALNESGSLPFSEIRDLLETLEETLVNVCEWSGIPTEPGGQFISDHHFTAGEESDRAVEIHDTPFDEIERDQDSILVRSLTRLADSDLETLDQLIADGGRATVDDLSDETGWSTRTIYRVVSRLGELVDTDRGEVSFLSPKIQEDVREVVRRVEDTVEAGARVLEDLLGVDQRSVDRAGRAFRNWLRKYGLELVDDGTDGEPMHIRARHALAQLKSASCPDAREIAHHGFLAYQRTGRDPAEILDARFEFEDAIAGGTTVRSIRSLRRARR
jgi:hypothetical protein